MPLQLITSSDKKFEEISQILAPLPLERVAIDLAEIQSLDPHEVAAHKLREAQTHAAGRYLVEDSYVVLGCMGNKLPGPFVKFFYEALGCEGLVDIVSKTGNDRASWGVMIGYLEPGSEPRYFEGVVHGRIVPARGDKDFGFGPAFLPEGSAQTFGEMERAAKHAISARGIAARAFTEFLANR